MFWLKLTKIHNSLFSFLKKDRGSCLFFFLVGLVLRGIPELLVSWYPIGSETITWYAPSMMTFAERSMVDVFVEFLRAGPLFYVLMWLTVNVTHAHPFLILKVTGPLLYGSLSLSFFIFMRKGLKLDWKMAFVASLLLVLQVGALRESWDRFRTVLGLVFLFTALTALKIDHKWKWPLFSIAAVLTVFCREYVAATLFVTVLSFVLLEKKQIMMSVSALCPAVAAFAVTIHPRLFEMTLAFVSGTQSWYESNLWMFQDATVIFVVCYLALLPFVLKGWFRDKFIGPMVGLLLLSSFSVINPWIVVPGYQRWLMLLVFPFCIYAVKGFERFQLFSKHRTKILAAIMLYFLIIGLGYCTGTFSYIGRLTNSYVAVNLVQSSISWDQVENVKTLLVWLNENAAPNSLILTEERFYGWTLIYLERANEDVKIIPYAANCSPMLTFEATLREESHSIYLIWFTEQIVDSFEIIHSRNSVSVFQYTPKVT